MKVKLKSQGATITLQALKVCFEGDYFIADLADGSTLQGRYVDDHWEVNGHGDFDAIEVTP